MIEIALATNTAPRDWWRESDAVLATALELLEEQAARVKAARKGR